MNNKFNVGDKVDTLAHATGQVKDEGEGIGTIVKREWNPRLQEYIYEVRWSNFPEEYPSGYSEDELVKVSG